jgi:hypothetical protein
MTPSSAANAFKLAQYWKDKARIVSDNRGAAFDCFADIQISVMVGLTPFFLPNLSNGISNGIGHNGENRFW